MVIEQLLPGDDRYVMRHQNLAVNFIFPPLYHAHELRKDYYATPNQGIISDWSLHYYFIGFLYGKENERSNRNL